LLGGKHGQLQEYVVAAEVQSDELGVELAQDKPEVPLVVELAQDKPEVPLVVEPAEVQSDEPGVEEVAKQSGGPEKWMALDVSPRLHSTMLQQIFALGCIAMQPELRQKAFP